MAQLALVDAPAPSRVAAGGKAGHRRPADALGGLDALLDIGVTMTIEAGRTLAFEGDRLRYCYRIVSGAVRLYKGIADGRRQVIDFLGAGETFGLLGHTRYGFSAEAMVACTVVRYNREPLERLVMSGGPLPQALFELACTEVDRMQRQMLLLGRKSAEEKIASFILAFAERRRPPARDGDRLSFPMSRQDMADYLGLTIETVSRTFTRLKNRGLIALPAPQHLVLLDVGALEALAEGLA